MPNSSTLASLSERLAQKIQEDRQQIEALTQGELQQLTESLKALSAGALSSTRSAIESETAKLTEALTGLAGTIDKQSAALANSTGRVKSQADAQAKKLANEIEAQTKRLIWLMKWPALVTLALCLMICLGTWGYWKLATPWTTEGAYQVMKGGGWTLCNVGTQKQPINRPCRQAN